MVICVAEMQLQQAIAPLAEQQVQQRASHRHQPDKQQPEQLLRRAQIIADNHYGQKDVANQWHKKTDRHYQGRQQTP